MSNIISNPTLDVSNILSTSGVAYVTATPTWNPDLTPKDAKIAINQETSAVWLWDTNKVGAADGAWVLYGLVASQAAAGSPSYTPTNASEIVVDGAGVVWAYNPLTSLWRTPTSTDLSVTTRTANEFTLESSDGIDVVIPASSATEAGLFTAANHVALAAAIVDVADLVTLTGVAANEPDLGTFSGTIIPDDSTIKAALQALETATPTADSGLTKTTNNIQLGGTLLQETTITGDGFDMIFIGVRRYSVTADDDITLTPTTNVVFGGYTAAASKVVTATASLVVDALGNVGTTALLTGLPAATSLYNSDALAAAGGIAVNSTYWADSAHEEGAVHGTLKLRTV